MAKRWHAVHGRVRRIAFQHVARQGEMDGSRTPSGRHAQRPAGHVRHQPGVIDPCVPGGDGAEQRLLVQLRQDPSTLLTHWGVRGQAEERNRRPLSLRDSWHDVGCPAAARPLADSNATAHPGVDIRHKRSRAFVSGHDVPNPVPRVVEGVVEGHPGVPR